MRRGARGQGIGNVGAPASLEPERAKQQSRPAHGASVLLPSPDPDLT